MRAWDYPKDPVVIACQKCGRYGKYSKAQFMELVGDNTSLTAAKYKIAESCPHLAVNGGDLRTQCGVFYPELLYDGDMKKGVRDD